MEGIRFCLLFTDNSVVVMPRMSGKELARQKPFSFFELLIKIREVLDRPA